MFVVGRVVPCAWKQCECVIRVEDCNKMEREARSSHSREDRRRAALCGVIQTE